MLRKILFWAHLSAGVLAGLVIFIMSVTGVLLTFQRQITSFVDHRNLAPITQSVGSPRPVEELLQSANISTGLNPTAVTISREADEPYQIELGREKVVFIDPYSGAVLGEGSQKVRRFFRVITDWHRWMGTQQESRPVGRAITGACNLLFLGIVITGPFLWLPRKWSWSRVRAILFFRRGLSGKARDFNWHNVIGIWSAIPLIIIVATAVVMSYSWANNALYRITGNQPPQQSGPEGGQRGASNERREGRRQGEGARRIAPSFTGFDVPLEKAQAQDNTWRLITMRLPSRENPGAVSFTIINGIDGRPDRRSQLVLARESGELIRWEPFATNNAGRRLRIWFRFLHTGEAGGIAGQTIAGLATAGGAFLVYTGIALAFRRLVAWSRRRKGQRETVLVESAG